ncbi:EthD domain-containing protein [Acidiferrimicrobium sp. IK]|uniref:EthD domain-containing protein n=1 Tax=Acidiferrimicrobium sp. IK TaxID=2871700 RepID=UPI0021CAEC0C|nr:EthD domain-containing protein [Acidiferrimicrobium sp. IK]MCU4186755.1 EthD domain-containing protein [Acidiferrimicrobium sp. IK]
MIKTILGYDIEPNVTEEEYERWLFDVHVPDILANPHVDRLVFNKVVAPVATISGGSLPIPDDLTFYRIAEMHFRDQPSYQAYREWFAQHPIPDERSPKGRTRFKFYVVTEVTEVAQGAELRPSFLEDTAG